MMDKIRAADQHRVNFLGRVGDRWRNQPKWQRWLFMLAGVLFLYHLPNLGFLPGGYHIPGLDLIRTDAAAAGSAWSSVLFVCAVYTIVAIGLNVVVGLAGLLDLGYIGFFALGAYSVAIFGSTESPVVKLIQEKWNLPEDWSIAWAICFPIAVLIAMGSGVVLGWPTLRLRGDYLAIVTMGFGEIIRLIATNSDITGGPNGIQAIPGPEGKPSIDNETFGYVDGTNWYYLALTVLLLIVVAVRRLEHSRVGRSWLAIREDEDAAAVMGVPGFKFKLWAFAIGAAVGGMSGFLFASRQSVIDPSSFGLVLSISFVAMVVLGGSGNMAGVALGAFLLTYLPERFKDLALYRPLIVGVVLVIVMITRPQGLIPSVRRARELKDRQEEVAANA